MASVTLQTEQIDDWDSFHEVCAEAFGFPDFYGANMDAWIDCLSYLTDGGEMSRFELAEDEQLAIVVPAFGEWLARVPDVCNGFLECTALVNQGYVEIGDVPRLVLVLA